MDKGMPGWNVLNEDQQDYCNYLNNIPFDKLCYCGWAPLGKCYNKYCKESGKTREDFVRETEQDG
jgi:hypothetical protein